MSFLSLAVNPATFCWHLWKFSGFFRLPDVECSRASSVDCSSCCTVTHFWLTGTCLRTCARTRSRGARRARHRRASQAAAAPPCRPSPARSPARLNTPRPSNSIAISVQVTSCCFRFRFYFSLLHVWQLRDMQSCVAPKLGALDWFLVHGGTNVWL